MSDIMGCCPMGCGWTLGVDQGGHIVCSLPDCPRQTAAAEILADEETEHTVRFLPDTLTVRHPLRERLDDALMRCQLHEFIAGLPGPPVPPGTYRAVTDGFEWTWTEVAS